MRSIALLLLLLQSSVAFAQKAIDKQGRPPEPWRTAKQARCDATAAAPREIVGSYTCQLGIDGVWGEPAACRIDDFPAEAGQLERVLHFMRYFECDIGGTLTGLAFDGSVSCVPKEPDQIGHEALVDGKLRRIAGGYRLDTTVEMVKTYAYGSGDVIPRPTRQKVTRLNIALNVCKRLSAD